MLTNRELSELFRRAADDESGHRRQALQRAARSAYFWPEEAADLASSSRSLTELPSVGPWVAGVILDWLEHPPELFEPDPTGLREDFLTLAEARSTLAEHPEWTSSLQADLQMHTTYSDGKVDLRTMVGAAAARGYHHVLITDHSKDLPIANGMDEERLAEQGRDIDALNEELDAAGQRLVVLKGIEMNLSPEGEGDMDPEALARLDLVLGAFHSKLRLKEDQTERYLAALANRTVHVLAHPRGRMFNFRLGLTADWPRVFAGAERTGDSARDRRLPRPPGPQRRTPARGPRLRRGVLDRYRRPPAGRARHHGVRTGRRDPSRHRPRPHPGLLADRPAPGMGRPRDRLVPTRHFSPPVRRSIQGRYPSIDPDGGWMSR